jgi:hypothetical protein
MSEERVKRAHFEVVKWDEIKDEELKTKSSGGSGGKYELEFFIEECMEYYDGDYMVIDGKHIVKKVGDVQK